MKVCVQGLWHLGSVTAACLASVGHDVVGLDGDFNNINNLRQGRAPLFEPGLAGIKIDRKFGEAQEIIFKAKLEKTKRYDVHEITKAKTEFNRKGEYKIYFTYKEWLREYDIMFSLIQEDIVKDVKKGNTTINLVYVDRSKGDDNIRIISESILTKRAVIEIDSIK